MSSLTKSPTSKRRDFMKQTAAILGAPFIIPASALGSEKQPAPSDRVTLACIGVGGRGTDDLKAFIHEPQAQIVAVCDVGETKRNAAKQLVEERYADEMGKGTYKGCLTYNDFRDVLARKDIDAVSIVTPDHWHVAIGIAAAKAGKDMFIEKPLSLKLEEGRLLGNAIEKYGRVFQHGTQQRTGEQFRHACELVRNKKIGELKSIRVAAPASESTDDGSPIPVPAGFDYTLWLGDAPQKPYTEKRVSTPWWYFISDYTLGYISGWGVHHIDIAQWGNGSDNTGPTEIEGTGEFPKGGLCDTAMGWEVRMKYANGIPLLYTDDKRNPHGILFEGTEGWVLVNREKIEAEPKSLLTHRFGENDIRLYNAPNLQQNLLECIKSRKETICPIETAHRSTSICHLSQIALLTKRKLTWDPVKEQFKDDPEANALLKVDTGKAAYKYDYYNF